MLGLYFILLPVNFVTMPTPGNLLCIHYPNEQKFGTTHNVKDQIPRDKHNVLLKTTQVYQNKF